ncbi:CbtB-domain containing protein [Arsenicicoccus piscis]|uniref:Cobalt transporter n=1 Tax=Arsenicicoccus piscis TaxID=673954 RepID=A0ABQ6HR37_9MICO|nr:CbtB domain-containing protein [Arsenicicoccus piscis]MCH8626317.1 CbtB-domain containing protein [Arsenicicoccus piscis]GMA20923.1 cobalt transporter [Arsenicicoccus piscis]
MSTVPVSATRAATNARSLSTAGRIAVLSLAVLLAVAIYYFVGVDEGMSSVFGKTLVLHEWVHDSRHLLGFPCH